MSRPTPPTFNRLAFAACGFAIFALTGCNSPNKANIELRLEVQKLNDEIAKLKIQHTGDEATIRALETKTGVQPTISQDLIEKLFTTHGLQLGRLTGPDDWDPTQPGDDGIKVSAIPIDEQGDKLKAAGSFKVEAFDLAEPAHPLVGEWKFDVKQARESWYGGFMQYNYILKCPWRKPPAHSELTIKVTFVDELTGREFSAQKVVKVTPRPAATQPASTPTPKPS